MIMYFTWHIYHSSPSISFYDMLTDVICRFKAAHFTELLDHSFSQLNLYRLHCVLKVQCMIDVLWMLWHGPLAKYAKLRVAHAPGMPGTSFPATAGQRSRHASRHVRDARAVMHAGIAKYRFPFKSVVVKTFPAFLVHAQPASLRIW